MNNKMDEIVRMEKSVSQLIQKTVSELVEKIRSTPVPDVKPIRESPCCFVINASVLFGGRSWSPEYYSASSQASIVEKALAGISTATALQKKLAGMLESKSVKFNGTTYVLNDTTLKAISEIL